MAYRESTPQIAGQQYDHVTGQYYLRARYYNPVVGRFLQEDTYRGDGLNLYAYCANNPVMYYDPSGHEMNYSNEQPQVEGTLGAGVDSEGGSTTIPDLSNKAVRHPMNDHVPTRYALNVGYKEALNNGVTTGKYSFTYLGSI